MEKYKSPEANRYYIKEIKNIKIKCKDNDSFHYSKSPNVGKNNSDKEIYPYKTEKKTAPQNDFLIPRYNNTEIKTKDKNKIIKNENPIKETILYNIPYGAKERTSGKEFPEKNNKNNYHNRNIDFNENKNAMEFTQKTKNLPVNYNIHRFNSYNNNSNNKMNLNQMNENNNAINAYNNTDQNLQNKNIYSEKSNQNQYNYINYNILNNNVNASRTITKAGNEGDAFKNINSVCVSINNNYNYNVSLETPQMQPEKYNDLVNENFNGHSTDEKNIQNFNKMKDMNLEKSWKEKMAKINRQKNMDYTKRINNSDNNYWRTKKEEKILSNISEDIYNNNINDERKIKKTNSLSMQRENNFIKMNNTENMKRKVDSVNEPKKKTGFFGLLDSVKDFFSSTNKKNKYNSNNNNSFNISKNNRKDNFSQDNENANKIENINIIRKNEYNNNNRIYNKRNRNNESDEQIYNYYSDSGYESCPTPNNPIQYTDSDDRKILSYSYKNKLKNNNTYNNINDNDIVFRHENSDSSLSLTNKKNQKQIYSNNNKRTEEILSFNNLLNIFKLKKDNNKNNYDNKKTVIHNYSNKTFTTSSLNDKNYNHNSAYVKKTKKRMYSPNRKKENNSYDNIDKEKELVKRFSFNDNINNNNMNNGKENRFKNIEKQKIIENIERNQYNSENINENLNINAERTKIQEININYKKNDDNVNNRIEDFIPEPKPQTKIESCIINFNKDKGKNKSMKIYDNNIQNPINNKPNNILKNTYDNNDINNNKIKISENYNSYSYSNIYDINNNYYNNNIYLKPNNKTYNLNQTQNIKLEKSLSFNDVNNNNNLDTTKQPKRKVIMNKTEKYCKINRLSDSEEFDNEIKTTNSYSSKNLSTQINTSIYNKHCKSFYSNDNISKSINSSQNVSVKNDSNSEKFNTSIGINYNSSDRDFNMTSPGLTTSNVNVSSYTEKKINNKRSIYLYNSINLNDMNEDNKNINNNKLYNSSQIVYTKKKNSNKNINANTSTINSINNKTPIPPNDYNIINNNNKDKINNIKTVIRPKIKQKNSYFYEKYYNYAIKYPNKFGDDYYYTKKYLKELKLKLPLKKISLYTKEYYKIIQKPKIKNNYIDKKIIRIKKGINLPISLKCIFVRKRSIIYNTPKINISDQKINKQIDEDNLVKKINKECSEVDYLKEDNENENEVIINDDKDVIINNRDEKKKENIIIDEEDKNINQNININNEIINKNRKYSTPTHDLRKNEKNQILSPQFGLLNRDDHPKSAHNKIISIEINLNNKDKCEIKKNNTSSNFNPMNNKNNNNNNILNTSESLYIKKKPNSNNNTMYRNIDSDKCKTYKKVHKSPFDEISVNDFYNVNPNYFNQNNNNNANKSNKIICIDIDLFKEQKKIKEQKLLEEQKKIRTYKRPKPTLSPLIDPTENFENKINSIEINSNQQNNNNNININSNINNININLNNDKLKQSILNQLDILSDNNLILIVDEIENLLTKKKVMNNNKIRLSFIEILTNEYSFVETIINRVTYDINKITIYADLCNQLCIRLTKGINFRGNDTEEDLKTILVEESKSKFEEIINDYRFNKDNKLLGIVLFIGELINYRIISLNMGYHCFEALCFQNKSYLYENNSINNNYLDIIIEFLGKFGKMIFIEKNLKYMKGIETYAEQELNYLINNEIDLSVLMRNKIINLMKSIKNYCMV